MALRGPNINSLENSATGFNIIVTSAGGVQQYVSPGANGNILTIVAGVPTWQAPVIPSEFDQYANFAAFPPVGALDVIYLDIAGNVFYVWNGAAYVQVPAAAAFSFTGAGNSGPSQAITNGQTANWLGSNGFTVVASAARNFTVTPPLGTVTGQVMYWNNGTSTWNAVALTGTDIANTPAGNIAATNVQTAINELDTEKNVNIQWQDEGVNLGAAGNVDTINIVGTGIAATRAGNTVTINAAASAGEANTASNVNVGGVGVFKQKTGVNLEFRGVNNSNAGISVTLDAPNNEIDLAGVASATAGNVISIDGTGFLAKQVVEFFSPANATNTVTLATTPKAGTLVLVKVNSVVAVAITDWSIAANVITFVSAFANSSGGTGLSGVEVTYWV